MKKGYVLILLFALFVAAMQSLKYRSYFKHDLSPATRNNLIIQIVLLFLLVAIAGILVVRWYYKLKNK